MTSVVVKSFCSLVLMVVAVYGTYSGLRWFHMLGESSSASAHHSDQPLATTTKPPRPLSEFTFTERSGKDISFKSLEGKVWVASFFFSECSGFCKQMNLVIAGLEREFHDQGVTFVSITVDPRNDTPQRLAGYAKRFDADPEQWLFLTGRFEDALDLGQGVFRITVLPRDHTDRLVLVDRDGKVRGTYHATDPAQVAQFQKEIKRVLAEEPTEKGDKSNHRESDK